MSRKTPITKQQVERALGQRISDKIWKYAVEKRYVAETVSDPGGHPDPLDYLVKEIKKLMALEPTAGEQQLAGVFVRSGRRQRRQARLPLRQDVISELLAGIVRRRADVQAFRDTFLSARLLKHEEVREWIQSQVAARQYLHAMLVKLPSGVFHRLIKGGGYQLPPGLLEGLPIEGLAPVELLEYSTPDNPSVQQIPSGRDGVLHQLRSLSELLARVFGWQKAQATVFILTDNVPLLPTLTIAFSRGSITQDSKLQRHLQCLARVTLTIDPFITPRDVAEQYRKERASIFSKNPRTLSEKNMCLAAFCCDLPELKHTHMREWNKKHPKWDYSRFSNFSRDAKRAHARLLGLPLRTDPNALF